MDQLISFLFVTLVYTVILYFLYEGLMASKEESEWSTLTKVIRFCGFFYGVACGVLFSFGFLAFVSFSAEGWVGSPAIVRGTFADRITSIPFLIGTIVPSFFMTMFIYFPWYKLEFGHDPSKIDSYIVKTFGRTFVLVLLAFWAGIELHLSQSY